MMINQFNIRVATAIAGLAMLAAACSSTSTSGSSSTSSSSSAATTSTVDSTPDTVADTTSTTTTVPAPIVLTLRGDGIGPFDLGVASSEVIDAMIAQFGPATFDERQEYPVDDGSGSYQSPDGEFAFAYPFGRSLCWASQFCAEFGGTDTTTEVFTGWSYSDESGLTLASTSGVTIGSRWSDFPAMNVNPGGCYIVGYGDIDGIALTLQSDDVAFGSFDDDGDYVETVPPPEQVAVTFMQTGDIPIHLLGDC